MDGKTRHAVYDITYHLVWCPKYRREVLTGPVAARLEQLICSKVSDLDGEVIALEVQPDHVHLFVSFPPTLAVCEIVRRVKGSTSFALRREYPWLRSRLPSLWTRSYYAGTAGKVSAETIQRYIEAQEGR